MRQKIKDAIVSLFTHLFSIIVYFYLLKSLFNIINIFIFEFNYFWFSIIGAIIVDIAVSKIWKENLGGNHITEKGKRIAENIPKITIGCWMFLVASSSIRKEIRYTTADIKEILTVEWQIFGLVIAVFLVLYGFLHKYFTGHKPELNKGIEAQLYTIYEKFIFAITVEMSYIYSKFIMLSAFTMSLTTAWVYIKYENRDFMGIGGVMPIVVQTSVIITFWLLVISLSGMIYEMCNVLNKKEKKILEGYEVTKEDIDAHIEASEKIQDLENIINEVENAKGIDEQTKTRIIVSVSKELIKYSETDSQEVT